MTDQELQILLKDNKDNLKEMFEFWTWIRGLNKALKWSALVGLPIAVGIWGFLKWVKDK